MCHIHQGSSLHWEVLWEILCLCPGYCVYVGGGVTGGGSGQLSETFCSYRQELDSKFVFCRAPGERFCYLSIRVHVLRDGMRV